VIYGKDGGLSNVPLPTKWWIARLGWEELSTSIRNGLTVIALLTVDQLAKEPPKWLNAEFL
jgi:hypothetical protein